jgi:hypothetical protein
MAHFVLVFAAAVVSTVLGALIGKGAGARDDARLWLVSLVFVISAGSFALHALVTPGILVQTSDVDFMLPSRVGLPAGAVAATLAERFDLTEQQIAVLNRGAEALGAEREQVRKLGELVAVGQEANVITGGGDVDDTSHVGHQRRLPSRHLSARPHGVGDTFAAIRLALDVISRAHCSVGRRTAAHCMSG